ncbi:MAG: response regulator [Deltaproteobacteria bacterium]|nr:response regulator [Deltaproteobacteria bacterium]
MTTPSRKGRILIIDDSEALLGVARAALTPAGYEVVTTAQTVGAARHLRECDLVLVDFHMPGLDGRAVLQSLRAAASASASPPLFYLYTSDLEVERDPEKLGFDGAIRRKGNPAALVQEVDAVFRMLRLRALQRRS